MSNLNKVFLMGRLTRDPELRYTPQGTAVAEFGLAVNRVYNSGNERKEETLFIDVTVWQKRAETVTKYLKKGRPVFIEGRLSMDRWEGQDGQKRTRYRVIAEQFQFIDGGGRRDDDEGGRFGDREASGGANYGDDYRGEGKAAPGPAAPGPTAPGPAATGPAERVESGESFGPGLADEDIPF